MTRVLLILAMVLAGPVVAAAAETPARPFAFVTEVRALAGDDPAWAAPAHDDSKWALQPPWRIDPQGRILWIRARAVLPEGFDRRSEPLGVHVAAAGSWEAYWNGAFVGRNGVPGPTRAAEVPGKIDATVFVPPALIRDGQNLLALRISSFHGARTLSAPIQAIVVERYGYLAVTGMGMHPLIVAVAGALLLGSVYFAVMFLLDRRDRASLLLSLLALAVLGQFLAELTRRFVAYDYPLHALRVDIILAFAIATAVLLVSYVAQQYFPRRLKALLAAAVVLVALSVAVVPGYDAKTMTSLFVALVMTLALAAVAAYGRMSGAWGTVAATAGVLTVLVLDAARFLDQSYYVAVTAFLLFLFVRQAHTLRMTQRQSSAAELRAVQLELELLKQQIQPHFLMNTLTALSEWIESDPRVGVKMIDALAAEFRAVAAMSGAAAIPMQQELELCRHHLAVMGFRKDQSFELHVHNVDPNARVPPAIFHTLLENALTHNHYDDGALFTLEEQVEGDNRVYRLRSPLCSEGRAKSAGGMGHSYIRARLRNAFGERWRFLSGTAAQGQWVDTIEVPLERS